MKISYNWLKDHIDIKESPEKIADLLTRSGLEVEGLETFESIKGSLEGFVIGEVLTCEKHPDADKLSLTTVNIGQETPSPIVCGAPNVAAGQKVIVATLGTTVYLPNNESLVIKKAKIRGQVSEGMICAEDELGIGSSHDGILVLDTKLPNGTPASTFFNIEKDTVLEIGLTPNRVDGASHFGTARELKALIGISLLNNNSDITFPTQEPIHIEVENTVACPRYAGVCIENISVAPSPEWLQTRLKSIGLNPINNVVDITNYILHDLGQPLHAFDLKAITSKEIRVKTLAENTPFTTLDGEKRKLKAQDLLICNGDEPMCFGGVFGGLDSGVTNATTSIFLESAYFSPEYIRKTSQVHGIKTDASFRFERGTDPNMVLPALKKATQLICEITGGNISSKCYDLYPQPIENFQVKTTVSNIEKLIGKEIGEQTISKILQDLDIEITENKEGTLLLSIPPYRVDVQREADIVEEVLRIYGYDNVELSENLAAAYLAPKSAIDKESEKTIIGKLLSSIGFQEIVTNSLSKEEYTQNIAEIDNSENVNILNKLSEDLGILRRSMLYTGLEVVAHNINRRQSNLKLFEFGKTYHLINSKYKEIEHLALYLSGNEQEETWQHKNQKSDYHNLANALSAILTRLGITRYETTQSKHPLLSYGLDIVINKQVIGSIGEVKKSELKKTGIKQTTYYAELLTQAIFKNKPSGFVYNELSKFPEVRRDLSLVLDKKISFTEIQQLAKKAEQRLLQSINVFDIYEGENIGENKKSYSVSFILQDHENTLTDKVIDKTMNKLIQTFEKELGAIIRK